MKVGPITTKICKNKTLKKGLELAADNGALFVAGSQLALAMCVRPLSIINTPKTDKENKKLACAKSFASSLTNYLMVLGVSLPISRNVKKIDTLPEKYLKPETIKTMKDGVKPLVESKSYQFATQMFKLGANAVTAVPRAIVTCALIPPIMSLIQSKKKKTQTVEQSSTNNLIETKLTAMQTGNVSFMGVRGLDLAKKMGQAIDSPFMQKISEKYKDSNFPMHTMAATDTLTTLTLFHQVNHNKKIDEDRKKTLNYNAGLSTSLGILSGYAVDKLTNKPTEKFIKSFSEINKADPKLSKYIEGIRIAKPTVIYGGVYYALIPVVSTFFAERLNKKKQ